MNMGPNNKKYFRLGAAVFGGLAAAFGDRNRDSLSAIVKRLAEYSLKRQGKPR